MAEGSRSFPGYELRVIPPLHIITDDAILGRPNFLGVARELLRAGGDRVALHLRGPGRNGRTLFRVAEALVQEATEAGAVLVVNDRLDVALSLGLKSVHLGQRSLPPDVARRLLGPNPTLGLSVHGTREASEASKGVVDYVVVGAVYPTPSHPGVEAGGVALIEEVGALDPPPMVGIGGITPAKVKATLEAGAVGVAVRGGIWETSDPIEALGHYLMVLAESPSGSSPTLGGKARKRLPGTQ